MDKSLIFNKYQPLYFNDFENPIIENQMIENPIVENPIVENPIVENPIVDIIYTLINLNNLNIIFIGDIGSGKTTFLNATIKEYYHGYTYQQYNDNILHINSLKEQGINYYRNDVKTFCQTRSSINDKKKFIVLDDIDIINEQSQQVFRNYMDKYSNNVHFIASCSNSQKVIESLQSRFIIIKIKPLVKHNIHNILQKISTFEKIHIHPEAVEFILTVSNNNAKILINYMEKFKLLNEPITLDIAISVCTNISFVTFEQYTTFLKNGELSAGILLLYSIYDKGYSVMDILDNYFLFVKFTRLLTETQKYDIVPIICKYITVFYNIHEDEIELAVFSNNIYNIITT